MKMTPPRCGSRPRPWVRPDTEMAAPRAELSVTRQTLYRHVPPTGELRPTGSNCSQPSRTDRSFGRRVRPLDRDAGPATDELHRRSYPMRAGGGQ